MMHFDHPISRCGFKQLCGMTFIGLVVSLSVIFALI